jgi:hypothetical protein
MPKEFTVCPRHEGHFDCNVFCDLCGGEQEYLADDYSDPTPETDCEEYPPDTVTIESGHFTGAAFATCSGCKFMSVSWNCNHDLIHDCTDYQRER